MTQIFRSIAKMLMAITISFGVTPPAAVLLELLRRPAVQVVAITRRRKVDYTAMFDADEGSGVSHTRAAARFAMAGRRYRRECQTNHDADTRTYKSVRTA